MEDHAQNISVNTKRVYPRHDFAIHTRITFVLQFVNFLLPDSHSESEMRRLIERLANLRIQLRVKEVVPPIKEAKWMI